MGRNVPVLLHTAGSIDTDEFQVFANVVLSKIRRVIGTGLQGAHRYPVAHLPVGYAHTNFGDFGRHLVADHLRNTDPLIHIAVVDVDIRTAYSAVRYLQAHLAGL